MKVTKFHSYYRAECPKCRQKLFVGRAEMADVIDRLFEGKAIVDFLLTCPCQVQADEDTPELAEA